MDRDIHSDPLIYRTVVQSEGMRQRYSAGSTKQSDIS